MLQCSLRGTNANHAIPQTERMVTGPSLCHGIRTRVQSVTISPVYPQLDCNLQFLIWPVGVGSTQLSRFGGVAKGNGKADRLCGRVVRVLGYRCGGPGSIPGTTRKK
jgi:hypothetical protein